MKNIPSNNTFFRKRTAFFILFHLLLNTATWAHDGESHGAEKAPKTISGNVLKVETTTPQYEAVLKYEPIEAGKEAHLMLYLADPNTNRPIEKATVEATVEGQKCTVAMVGKGVYELHAKFNNNKPTPLNVNVASPTNGADLIGLLVEVGKKIVEIEVKTPETKGLPTWLWGIGGLIIGMLLMGILGRKITPKAMTLLVFAISIPLSINPVVAHDGEDHGAASGSKNSGSIEFDVPKETQFLFETWTQTAASGAFGTVVNLYGTVVPSVGGFANIIAPTGGKIVRLNAAVGQKVAAGQVLAIIEQTVNVGENVSVATESSRIAVEIEQAKANIAATRRELDRLNAIKDVVAQRDILAAESAYQAAKIQLESLENIAKTGNTRASNRQFTIKAPISGIIGAFTLSNGSEVSAGQSLVSVTNLSKVYVEAQVFDRDVDKVRLGQQFQVICTNDDHKTANVRLISVAQQMNPTNQSQKVLFEMSNTEGVFKIGEFVTVKALSGQKTTGIALPNAALSEINGKSVVFLKTAPETFTIRYVRLGDNDGTKTLIAEGLKTDDKTIINGVYQVKMMYLNQ